MKVQVKRETLETLLSIAKARRANLPVGSASDRRRTAKVDAAIADAERALKEAEHASE